MFSRGIRLPFSVLGIPVSLDLSFLIVLPLFAFLIGSQLPVYLRLLQISAPPELLQGPTPYLLGLLAALGLFLSVLVHELGHALTARAYGVQTREITLWLLGGVAQLEQIPRARGAEAVIAIAGPIVSVLLSGLFGLLRSLLPAAAAEGQFLLGYLSFINLSLALFNLLPALPLDGGRILRSLLALYQPYLVATRTAVTTSKVLAFGLGLLGLLVGNLFMLLIAFFVFMAASAEAEQAVLNRTLEGLRVQDLMTRQVSTVPPGLSVAELLEKMMQERHVGYPVVEEGRLLGLISLEDLQGASPQTRVMERMRPPLQVNETAEALEALQRMAEQGFSRLLITDAEGNLVGILSKTDLLRALQLRAAQMSLFDRPSPPAR
ncbi:MAG: site-2 protease family protein [Meiothermus sp.]|uniref:site-2 protease family protein n=1 Tax=Meiothermus sp. TaxID=1955249 RepID=UPI0025CDBCB1|nr:site-2 protease family protein [Meiothermus sp.]MCS7068272.1 site-2 protease family protein [Meiothermus sp.]MCX7602132.1 site-2 protease family protein [Meiothermus sp.]MDW8425181.1 site-2 protease family protein [Meiothermus sp.]